MKFYYVIAMLGCAWPHTYAQDIETMCFALERSGTAAETDPERRAMVVSHYLDDNLTNPDARRLFEGMASAAPDWKARLLQDEATKVGLASCPMADAYVP